MTRNNSTLVLTLCCQKKATLNKHLWRNLGGIFNVIVRRIWFSVYKSDSCGSCTKLWYIRQDENALDNNKKKTINKQPSVPFTILILTLPRDWIGIQLILVSCIQRSPFWLFTLIFRTSLLNASAWRAFSMNVIIDHLITSENEFAWTAPKRSSWRFVQPKWMVYTLDDLWSNIPLNLSFRPVLLLLLFFFFPLQNTVKVPSSFL